MKEEIVSHDLADRHEMPAVAVHEIVLDEEGRPVDYVFLSASPAFEAHTGLRVSEIIGRRVTEVLPGIDKTPFIKRYGRVSLTGDPISFRQYSAPLGRHYLVHAFRVEGGRFATVFTDISKMEETERQRRISLDVLKLLNSTITLDESAGSLISLLRCGLGIEAVGIRVAEEEDFPYIAHEGFPAAFMASERFICSRNEDGLLRRGLDGKPLLACICGLVLAGQTDPAEPLFSPGGSAWTNDVAQYTSLFADNAPSLVPRNQCFKHGYRSVALIPIRAGGQIAGILQLNDHREGLFSAERIAFLEGIAESIGVAYTRLQKDSVHRRLQTQLSEAQQMAHLGSWEYTVKEDRLCWSEETYRIFGINSAQFKEPYEAFQDTVHPEDRDAVVEAYALSLRDPASVYDIEHRIIRKDNGEIRHVHERCRHHRDAQGRVMQSFGMVQDITGRKRMEEEIRRHGEQMEERVKERTEALQHTIRDHRSALEALKQSEIYNCALFAAIPDPLFIISRDGRFLDCKVQSDALLLMPRDQFIGRRVGDMLPPNVAAPLLEKMAGVFAGGRATHEYQLIIKNETKDFEASMIRMDSERVLVVIHDITGHKRRERDVLRKNALILSLMNSIPDIVFFKDREGRYLGCNPEYERLLGLPEAEIIGKNDYDFYDKQTADAFRENDRITRELGEMRHDEEWVSYPDGRRVLLDTLKTPYRQEDGALIGILGISRDITERHEARQRMERQERLYRGLVESQNDLMVRVDTRNCFTFVNDAYCKTFGKRREELLGRSFSPLIHPDDLDATLEAMKGLHEPPYRVTFEQRATTKEGWRWIAWEDCAVQDEEGNVIEVQGVGRDITALKDAQRAAEVASKAKSSFLAHISHDIRTPLNLITGYANILKQDPLTEKQQAQVGMIARSGDHLLMLVNGILDYAKLEDGRVTLNQKEFRVRDFLADLGGVFSELANEKGVEFRLESPTGLPAVLQADETKLRQVLFNLLSNALKFTDHGSVTLRLSVNSKKGTPGLSQGNVRLLVEVEDTGQGIADEDLESLFDPFFQGCSGQGGTGLGLAICRSFIELMGGHILVESEVGKGSCFRFAVAVKSGEGSGLDGGYAPSPAGMSYKVTREDLAALPRELRQGMLQAVRSGDAGQLKAHVAKAEVLNSSVGQGLRLLAARYDYETLGMLLEGEEDGNVGA